MARPNRRARRGWFLRANSCSHMRMTFHPARRNVRVTSASRFRFVANFFRQNAALPFGLIQCFGQQCQKQPSTNIAVRALGKIKSGRTVSDGWRVAGDAFLRNREDGGLKMEDGRKTCTRIFRCLRQPVILFARNRRISASSVSLFPRERMRDITSLRLALVKTSGMELT